MQQPCRTPEHNMIVMAAQGLFSCSQGALGMHLVVQYMVKDSPFPALSDSKDSLHVPLWCMGARLVRAPYDACYAALGYSSFFHSCRGRAL